MKYKPDTDFFVCQPVGGQQVSTSFTDHGKCLPIRLSNSIMIFKILNFTLICQLISFSLKFQRICPHWSNKVSNSRIVKECILRILAWYIKNLKSIRNDSFLEIKISIAHISTVHGFLFHLTHCNFYLTINCLAFHLIQFHKVYS